MANYSVAFVSQKTMSVEIIDPEFFWTQCGQFPRHFGKSCGIWYTKLPVFILIQVHFDPNLKASNIFYQIGM